MVRCTNLIFLSRFTVLTVLDDPGLGPGTVGEKQVLLLVLSEAVGFPAGFVAAAAAAAASDRDRAGRPGPPEAAQVAAAAVEIAAAVPVAVPGDVLRVDAGLCDGA